MRHLNGETLKKIAEDVKHDPETVSKGVNRAAEALVEYGQAKLMQDVFPLVTELYRTAVQAEIVKVKEGKELDWKLIDKLLKGLAIVDRPIATPSQLTDKQQQPLVEGYDTLTGFIASRTPPPRIGDRPEPIAQLPQGEIIDVSVEKEPNE